jgi:hypothetical protein
MTERLSVSGMLPRTLTSIEMIAEISRIGLVRRRVHTSVIARRLITRRMDS